jgi:NhaA family Na+:H+ antiporter
MGAVGGMAVPALIFVAINLGHPEHLNGWAIPAATDIAFALGILALLGSRAPLSLKVLLTAIAIIDDLGAIMILAVFYTDDLSLVALGFGFVFFLGLIAINGLKVTRLAPYVLLGIALWVCVLKSGVHATLAGVITAFAIPLRTNGDEEHSLLRHVEHELHPWIAFAILPIFAFANAGVSFTGMDLSSLIEPVKLGVSLGLFVGKQIGVFGLLWLCVRLGWSPLPPDTNWVQLYGVALLCGVGFTMSLFIGSLAFEHTSFDAPIRLGVLTGSLVSGLCGYLLLQFGPVGAPKQPEAVVEIEPEPEPREE